MSHFRLILVTFLFVATTVNPVSRSENNFGEKSKSPVSAKSTRNDRLGDPLPTNAIFRLGTTRLRQVGEAKFLSFVNQAKQLWSYSEKHKRLHIWDTTTGRLIHSMHLRRCLNLACCRQKNLLAWIDWEKAVQLVDLNKKTLVGSIPLPKETKRVTKMAFSPNGDHLAVVNNLGEIYLWRLKPNRAFGKISSQGGDILALTFSPKKRLIAFLEGQGKLFLWNYDSSTILATIHHPVSSRKVKLLFSPSGSHMASCSNQKLTIWNVQSGEKVTEIQEDLRDFCFWDDNTITLLTKQGRLTRVDWKTQKRTGWLSLPTTDLHKTAFSADGQFFANEETGDALYNDLYGNKLRLNF